MKIRSFPVKSFSDYVVAIKEINSLVTCHASEIWYRGVSDESYELYSGVQWRGIQERKHEGMVDEFLTSCVLYDNTIKTLSAFEQYALMQHYGLPTRLLDWTISPLVALYFALEKDEVNEKRVVWCMNHTELNQITTGEYQTIYTHNVTDDEKFELDGYLPASLSSNSIELKDKAIAIKIQFTNKRISSQQGTFTLHGSEKVKIEDYFVSGNNAEVFKIEIDGKKVREELKDTLMQLGITEDSIYQDLNSLSKRLMREFF